jgi:solute carrier family 35 protein F5
MSRSSRAYLLGLFFIVLVCIIWSASSLLTQYVYTEHSFRSPFLLTYVGVSLFSLWLPVWYVRNAKRLIDPGGIEELPTVADHDEGSAPPSILPRADVDLSAHADDEDDEDDGDGGGGSPYFRSSPLPPGGDGLLRRSTVLDQHRRPWTQYDHLYAAARIAPVWFAANWSYNASLAYTSITSSTVLASTGSVFTFAFAVCTRDERFGWIKLAGVLLGVSGSVVTALTDVSNAEQGSDGGGSGSSSPPQTTAPCDSSVDYCYEWPLLGDLLGLLSAMGYGLYAVQTRLYCPHDESLYSMQLLLGYIGLICMVGLSPVDNVLSDYLWLRAVILTSATVATVGLGLTIPLAFLSDLWQGEEDVVTFGSVGGALLVLCGFFVVNHETDDEHAETGSGHRAGSSHLQEHQELSTLSHDSLGPLTSWDDEDEEEVREMRRDEDGCAR